MSLHDYAGRNVVVYFYPAAMTPGCTKEACDFRDNLNSLAAAGYQVLGISKERVRQIEVRALEKLKAALVEQNPEFLARAA